MPDVAAGATQDTTDSAQPLVRIEGAGRSFGDDVVLEDINLAVTTGEIFGLVGPSGCGKTTLVKLIVGLLKPSEGTVLVNGVSPANFSVADKRAIGYVPQDFSLYPSLTVWENARFMASIYGLGWLRRRHRIRDVLSLLEIWDARDRMAENLSGGMKRRLSLAGALLHEPAMMIVDEPTAGIDPVLRVRIWELLREIRDLGTTIFITTQYIEEAERCDRVGVLSEGRLVAASSPATLREGVSLPDVIEVTVTGVDVAVLDALWNIPGVRGVDWDRIDSLAVRAADAGAVQPEVEKVLASAGLQVTASHHRQASFEEVFMRYTGQG